MLNQFDTTKINFVINCRINSIERIRRLIYLSDQISNIPNFALDLRIRGDSSSIAFQRIQSVFDGKQINEKQYRFWPGTNSGNNWKIDTLMQVLSGKSEYVVTLQEDHFLQCSIDHFISLIKTAQDSSIDFMPLTFFPHIIDKKVIDTFVRAESCMSNDYFNYFYISRDNFQTFKQITLLSQVGLYKTKFLVDVLKSEKPFVKKYNHKTPYSFEQTPGSDWFLPLCWGYSKSEIFACVDDDHGISGYSLVSRGLWRSEKAREIEFYHPVLRKNSFFIKYKYFFMPVFYTLYAAWTRPYRLVMNIVIHRKYIND